MGAEDCLGNEGGDRARRVKQSFLAPPLLFSGTDRSYVIGV